MDEHNRPKTLEVDFVLVEKEKRQSNQKRSTQNHETTIHVRPIPNNVEKPHNWGSGNTLRG